jgi:dUTP pyrophosphatase
VLNTPGTIDGDFRGEIRVILKNHSPRVFCIECGMRIAQLIVTKYEQIQWNVVDELQPTCRGAGGLGSTGD